MQSVIWTPPAEVVDRARVTAFMREQGIADWRDLGRRAQDDIGWFWDAVVAHLGLEFATPYTQVYDESDGPMWTRWFGGGRINLTHNCVDRHARDSPERTAVIWESEDGQVRTVSYGELEAEVNRIGNALLQLGVEPGQTVGLFLPMSVEVVAGFYAICKIGAIAVPIFSGFGAAAVAARLSDAGAVALLTADAVPRRGKPVSMKEVADAALEQAPSVRHVVVWDRLGTRPAMRSGRDHHWHELVASQPAELPAPPLDPETPMMVIYTSGTTGRPKGAVHVHGGFLVKIAEECAFQTDVARRRPVHVGDRHGLDHGPLGGGRRRRAGGDAGAVGGRARPPRPGPAVAAGGAAPDLGAGCLPHADPGAPRPRRRARCWSTIAARCGSWPRPESPGTPTPTAGCSRWWASGAARSSTCRAAPRSRPASCRRCR